MRVFVAGITGVLGRNLLPLLLANGHEVRALVRRDAPFVSDAVEVVSGDLLDSNIATQLAAAMRGCDATIHIATAIPRNPAAAGAWETNTRLRTEGTRRLLAATLQAQVPYYIQQSIVMAYADGGDRWLDEATPLDDTPARAGLVEPVRTMEALVRESEPNRQGWCILRGGAFVGPDTAQESLIASLREGQVVVPGDGSNYISPIHVADMAAAIIATLAHTPMAATFNIVDVPLQYGEYVDGLAERLGVAHPLRDPALPMSPSYRCSNRAAGELLNWQPQHSIWPAIPAKDVSPRNV